ncbi:hypothetical protein CLV32_3584 [Pedobacter duraquae]|uniref:Uncharacterized protein n=1 Tax=Pedobacter duraquae TaxID=425511 RepID=A0A4R6IGV2_9SPHI|nr:hypothetical protein CLV32_3584 [Pedobacter duraquae]
MCKSSSLFHRLIDKFNLYVFVDEPQGSLRQMYTFELYVSVN